MSLTIRHPKELRVLDWVLVGLAVLGAGLTMHWLWRALSTPMIDVDIYRLGGQALLDGRPLYALETQLYGLPYLYTPFAALLFAPLTALGLTSLHVVWTLISLAALVLLVKFSLERMAPSHYASRPILLTAGVSGAALLLEPVRSNLGYGQINIVLAALVIADLARPNAKRLPRGVLIGLAGAIKLTPLLFAVYLLGTRRVRAGITAFVTFAVCSALGFVATVSSSIDFWTRAAYDTSRVGVAYATNQSVNGVFARLFDGPHHIPITAKLVTLAIGGLVFLLALAYGRRGEGRTGEVLCGVTVLLMTPIAWSHHWMWAVPVLVWLTFTAEARWAKGAALAGFALFAVGPFNRLPKGMEQEYGYSPLEHIVSASYTIAALSLALVLAVALFRRRDDSGPATMAATVSQLDGRGSNVEEGRGSTGQGAG